MVYHILIRFLCEYETKYKERRGEVVFVIEYGRTEHNRTSKQKPLRFIRDDNDLGNKITKMPTFDVI